MTTTAPEFAAAVDKAYVNMGRFDGFVNGDDATDIPIDTGTIPSLANVIAQVLAAGGAVIDTDGTLAANSDLVTPSQKAVRTYVAAALVGLLEYKGGIDCSTNPNYPAASKGDVYVVSAAGKLGGAAGGLVVEIGDFAFAKSDTAAGDQSTVGSNWDILQYNLTDRPTLAGANTWAGAQTFNGQTNLGALTVMTAGGFRLVGATGGFQFWKDSGPSKAHSIDGSVPGTGITDDLVFARFNGSWAETFRIVNATKAALFQGDISAPNFDNDGLLAANSSTKLATQQAVKTYIDNRINGLSYKIPVRAATTASGTLATSFANGSVIDGVTLATGDRILVKNQATASENGIYVVNASGAPTRASDADSGAELVNATVAISEGTTLADQQWTCSTNAPITLGTTGLTFGQSNAGTGVTSVSLSPPSIFSVTVPTVTTSGTLTFTLANQNANLVWAGPSSGGASAPTFRSLVTADLPKVAVSTVSTSFTAGDADENTHKVASGTTQTLTLNSTPATGVSFTIRFTTAWSITCAGGLSKNGASPSGVTSGSVAANSLITFLHEGGGVWVAGGSGLT